MKQLMLSFFLVCSITTLSQDHDDLGISICNRAKEGYYVWYGKDRPELGIPDSGKIEEGTYINDRKEGTWIKYHDDGITPKLISEYKNNRPNGHFNKFYSNGKLKERGYFIRNQYIDTLVRFFENGKLEFFAVYDSIGKEHDTIRKYNPDGSLECEYEAVHGTIPNKPPCASQPVSVPKVAVEEEKKPLDVHLPDDHWKGNGPFKVYNLNDEIWQDGTFRDGKLWNGKIYIYDQDGILLKVEIYKNGVYHSDGQL